MTEAEKIEFAEQVRRAAIDWEARALAAEAERNLLRDDFYRVAEALDIGARPYSGHEAVERDFLPAIEELRAALAERDELRAALRDAMAEVHASHFADSVIFGRKSYGIDTCPQCAPYKLAAGDAIPGSADTGASK
jgi:hypothetical protein